jgi:hypothetical protein
MFRVVLFSILSGTHYAFIASNPPCISPEGWNENPPSTRLRVGENVDIEKEREREHDQRWIRVT